MGSSTFCIMPDIMGRQVSSQHLTDDDVFGSIIGYMDPASAPTPQPATVHSSSLPAAEKVDALPAAGESHAPVAPVDQVSYADAQIQEIDSTKIVPNPYQPRKIFEPEGLKDLADS